MSRLSFFISLIALTLCLCLSPATQAQGIITTVAGGVPNNVPALQVSITPNQIVGDAAGNLYFSAPPVKITTLEQGFGSLFTATVVYKVSTSGVLTVVAGNGFEGFSGDGGPATSAELNDPSGIAVDGSGNVFIADTYNDRIREVFAATGTIQTIAGNGTAGFNGDGFYALDAELDTPEGIVLDASGDIFITDGGTRIREIIAATGYIKTIAGNGTAGFSGDNGPAISAELDYPDSLAFDHSGNLFITDYGNNRIREVVAATGNIQTVAGNGIAGFSGDGGPATSASLAQPDAVSVDTLGDIFIADYGNDRIREVVASTSNIETVAGNGTAGFGGDGGPDTEAELDEPTGVFVDGSGNIFIADSGNNRIREAAAGIPTHLTCSPKSAQN